MESSVNELNIFDFSGSKHVPLICSGDDCREKCVDISMLNGKYRIELYCPICGEMHTYNINKNIFWARPLIALKCYASNMDALFIGSRKQVVSAIDEQQKIFDEARDHHDELNLVLEIIECINSFAEKERMYCSCGCHDIRAIVSHDEITLSCPDCNTRRSFKIDINTLTMLLNLDSIVLNNI